MKASIHKVFLLTSTLVVTAAVVYGFVVVGSPEWRRLERLDERRLADLQAIHREIQELVRDPDAKSALKSPLPATLEDLVARARRRKLTLVDPESGEAYGYAVHGDRVYELWATFARARDAQRGVFWNHPAGRHGFRFDALDPP